VDLGPGGHPGVASSEGQRSQYTPLVGCHTEVDLPAQIPQLDKRWGLAPLGWDPGRGTERAGV
jgi:hypothetical protein